MAISLSVVLLLAIILVVLIRGDRSRRARHRRGALRLLPRIDRNGSVHPAVPGLDSADDQLDQFLISGSDLRAGRAGAFTPPFVDAAPTAAPRADRALHAGSIGDPTDREIHRRSGRSAERPAFRPGVAGPEDRVCGSRLRRPDAGRPADRRRWDESGSLCRIRNARGSRAVEEGARSPQPTGAGASLVPCPAAPALSDGIYAIAMTLLVINVAIPAHLDDAAFHKALSDALPTSEPSPSASPSSPDSGATTAASSPHCPPSRP